MHKSFAVFFLLLFLYITTFGGHLYSPDGEILFRTTERFATTGSFAIEPLQGFATRPPTQAREDGREYAQYGIGQPILAAPFYWAGRLCAPLFSEAFWQGLHATTLAEYPLVAPGQSPPARDVATRVAASTFNSLITALCGLVLFLFTRRISGKGHAAFWTALLWGAGTVAWPHSRTFFTEPLAGFCVLLAFYLLLRGHEAESERAGRGWFLLAGLAMGYAVLTRLDSLFFLPGLCIFALAGELDNAASFETDDGEMVPLFTSFRDVKRGLLHKEKMLRLVAFCVPLAITAGLLLGISLLRFGNPFASGYSDQPEGIRFSTPLLAGLYGFFLSIGKGLFFFSPALLLALPGLRPMARKRPVLLAALALSGALFLLVMSKWQNWAGGWCWGPRHIVQLHILLAVPIAFFVAEGWGPLKRITSVVILVAAAAVQVYGCSQDFIKFYRIFYQDPRPPRASLLYDLQANRMVQNQFALIPRNLQTGALQGEVPIGATLNLPPGQAAALQRQYILLRRNPATGLPAGQAPLNTLPAPIQDSIYIVQNSQWKGYALMWKMGWHDLFWLHLIKD